MKIWGDYLITVLPDPGNQLCTDDFMGPSPHNINLAAKGIIGLGAYSQLLEMKGDTQEAARFLNIAKNYTTYWMDTGLNSDKKHYKLEYDKDNTWSMKYNLLFQPILGLDIFPQSVFDLECNFYESILNEYGLPLDSRAIFTKTDWSIWSASLCTND